MGLGTAAVQLYLELWQRGNLKGIKSAADMGSEELHLTRKQFEELVERSGIPGYQKENFPDLDNWPAQPRTSAKHFYKLLGITEYTSLDLNGELGAIQHDLNTPFEDKKYWNAYDLVTDFGTTEHAFNAAEAYRTMHRLCKKDGLIIISQAVFGGNGYYHYDLSFFEGLAAANGYNILFSSYFTADSRNNQFFIPLAREFLNLIDYAKVQMMGICYVFQKTNSNDFVIPYQGSLLKSIQKNSGYRLQYFPSPPTKAYIPMYAPTDLNSMPIKKLLKALIFRIKKRLGF